MISFTAVWAVVLRHIRMWKHDPNMLLFGLYWPVLDILIWGFLGTWLATSSPAQFEHYEIVTLLGLLLWQVVGRGCNYMVLAFSEELWAHNVVNLFSLPIKLTEWMAGVVLYYAIMMTITTATCMLVAFALYNVSMAYMISTFLFFFPPLFLSGIWVGFMCLQVIVSLGKRGIELSFIVGWGLMPFTGAFYPVEILPAWGQAISSILPMSYVFKGMREYLIHQQNPTSYIIKGLLLSSLYAICAVCLFIYFFNRSKQKGLARLTD